MQGEQGIQGIQGIQGVTGLAFTIAKTYASVAALEADTSPSGIVAGQFAIINTGDAEDEDNSKLYLWDGSSYSLIHDLSGAAGIQGITGEQGIQGIQGAQGIQGITGSQGATGTQGATGEQGTTGDQGIQGIQGITGAQGVTGTQGAQGIQGPENNVDIASSAPTSPSVGDLWWDSESGQLLIYYYDGSDYYWIEAVGVGPQGTQGIQGNTGIQGVQGIQGAQGITGSQGAT